MKFKAKRGLSGAITVWTIASVCILMSVTLFSVSLGHYTESSVATSVLWMVALFCFILGASLIMFWFMLNYELTEEALIIHQRPLRDKKLPFSHIESITKTNTVLAGPALSMKNRLIIVDRSGSSTVVAPQDVKGFILGIKKRDPHIRLDGNSLRVSQNMED